MKKINVGLYGGKGLFGGKETPLEADEIYCDRSEECTYYKSGKCLRCRSFLAPTCKFGRNSVTKGYTSRAKKYYEFKNKYTNDEVYSKLKYPDELVAVMGDTLYMNLKFTLVRKKKEEKTYSRCYRCVCGYEITEVGFCSGDCFLPIEDITNELLYGIFSYKPHAVMGGIIEDYQDKVVPDIIQSLKKVAPEIHKKFIKEYPQFDKEPNYIGKKIFVNSLKPNTKFKVDNKEWVFDGEFVCTTDFDLGLHSPWWRAGGDKSDVKIKVNQNMVIEVNDNSIVDENTRFA